MARSKATSKQLAEDDARTTSMGLFNTAEAYWRAAGALAKNKLKGGFAAKPVEGLYFHAIELYLKALLRQRYDVHALQAFRHDVAQLGREAETLGASLKDKDKTVLKTLAERDVIIEARYVRTGSKSGCPTFKELEQTCRSLRTTVGGVLRESGFPIRLPKP